MECCDADMSFPRLWRGTHTSTRGKSASSPGLPDIGSSRFGLRRSRGDSSLDHTVHHIQLLLIRAARVCACGRSSLASSGSSSTLYRWRCSGSRWYRLVNPVLRPQSLRPLRYASVAQSSVAVGGCSNRIEFFQGSKRYRSRWRGRML